MNYHLGCGFGRGEHGVLYIDPTKYLNKMIATYKQMYGQPARGPRCCWLRMITLNLMTLTS